MIFFEGDQGGASGAATNAGGAAQSSSGSSTLLGSAADANAGNAGASNAGAAQADSWASSDGTFAANWIERLPENLRGNDSLKPIGSIVDLAKSYVETKKLMGTKLEMPGEGATPEAVAAWRKVTGAPEKPEGYRGDAKTLRPESVPEAFWDPKAEGDFLAIAHKHSLPPAAVKEILGFHAQTIQQSLQAAQAQEGEVLQAEGAKLRQAWGKDYDAHLNLASRMAQTAGLDPKTNPIFTNAEVVQAFARIGRLLSEDRLVKGDTSNGINGSIAERVRDIMDPKSNNMLAREYRGEYGPERQKSAQETLQQLMQAQQT